MSVQVPLFFPSAWLFLHELLTNFSKDLLVSSPTVNLVYCHAVVSLSIEQVVANFTVTLKADKIYLCWWKQRVPSGYIKSVVFALHKLNIWNWNFYLCTQITWCIKFKFNTNYSFGAWVLKTFGAHYKILLVQCLIFNIEFSK